MPSTSWRSHFLPSCSVAELQDIADGMSGFVLPTEPANEVYPGVLLGDAWVHLFQQQKTKKIGFPCLFVVFTVSSRTIKCWHLIRFKCVENGQRLENVLNRLLCLDRRRYQRTNWINSAWLTSSTWHRRRPSPCTHRPILWNIPNGKTGELSAGSSAHPRWRSWKKIDFKLESFGIERFTCC